MLKFGHGNIPIKDRSLFANIYAQYIYVYIEFIRNNNFSLNYILKDQVVLKTFNAANIA